MESTIDMAIILFFSPRSFASGTDENAITDILANRTVNQRRKIATVYKACYGQVSIIRPVELYETITYRQKRWTFQGFMRIKSTTCSKL